MPRRGGRHFTLLSGAEDAMQAFRMEIAQDLGLGEKINEYGWEGLTTKEVGSIGGEMVKRIMIAGELDILQRFQSGQQRLTPEIPPDIRLNDVRRREAPGPGPVTH